MGLQEVTWDESEFRPKVAEEVTHNICRAIALSDQIGATPPEIYAGIFSAIANSYVEEIRQGLCRELGRDLTEGEIMRVVEIIGPAFQPLCVVLYEILGKVHPEIGDVIASIRTAHRRRFDANPN